MVLHGTVWSFEAVWYCLIIWSCMVLYGPWSFIHLVISAPAARSSWAAWLWLFIQANIRGVTLSQSWMLRSAEIILGVSYPFSSSESTLAPLRNSNVSSSWHPELGGALARPSLHQLWGKNVPKMTGGIHKLALGGRRVPKLAWVAWVLKNQLLKVPTPDKATKQVSHLAARWRGDSSSLPMQLTSAPRLNNSYRGELSNHQTQVESHWQQPTCTVGVCPYAEAHMSMVRPCTSGLSRSSPVSLHVKLLYWYPLFE